MKLLGAKVVPVSFGLKTLKEAVDSAFQAYLQDPISTIYCIGSVVGPHPFPMMVRDFQRVVGIEAREQFMEMTGELPDNVVACVGGGSNAMGIFSAFLDEEDTTLYGVEPLGRGVKTGDHAATMSYGKPGVIHGFKCYLLQDDKGEPSPVYSIASGLDYPGVGPEHSMFKDKGKVVYTTVDDKECLDAFFRLSRKEGIIPALESAHAVAYAFKLAKEKPRQSILVNLSGAATRTSISSLIIIPSRNNKKNLPAGRFFFARHVSVCLCASVWGCGPVCGQWVLVWGGGPVYGQSVWVWGGGPVCGQWVWVWGGGPVYGQSVWVWGGGPVYGQSVWAWDDGRVCGSRVWVWSDGQSRILAVGVIGAAPLGGIGFVVRIVIGCVRAPSGTATCGQDECGQHDQGLFHWWLLFFQVIVCQSWLSAGACSLWSRPLFFQR
jgi:cysteine synthase